MENGLYLSDHLKREDTNNKVKAKKWDYVILQGVGRLIANPDIFTNNSIYYSVETLKNKIFFNHNSTKIIFCMPWAYEDGMAWKDGWTDLFPEMQKAIYENTLKYAEEIGFMVAPVGWVWYAVLEEKNYPLHYLHLPEWNHPSLKASYLMACVIYSTIFQERATDNNYYAGIPEEDAAYFQGIASDIVLEDIELWRINNLYLN